MTYEFVENWLEKMKMAWLNADMPAIKSLFSKTTEYYETPFHKPATNITEIMDLWKGVEKQIIKKLEFTILAIENNTAIVQWVFERQETAFDGIYQIKFNDTQECVFFKSWEMEKTQ